MSQDYPSNGMSSTSDDDSDFPASFASSSLSLCIAIGFVLCGRLHSYTTYKVHRAPDQVKPNPYFPFLFTIPS